MDAQQLSEYLRAMAVAHGSQRALARHLHVSPQMLSDVLTGRRMLGPEPLAILGLERVVRYEKKDTQTA